MKTLALVRTALGCAIVFSSVIGGSLSAQEVRVPALKDVLGMGGGKAIVFQPTQIKPLQRLLVTHIHTGGVNQKPTEAQTVQLVVYSTTPDKSGEFPVIHTSSVEAGPGGGPVVRVFSGDGYTHPRDAEPTGIIAILIGLRTTPTGGVPANLPPKDVFSVQLDDPVGIALLLPAVQKVREAAAR